MLEIRLDMMQGESGLLFLDLFEFYGEFHNFHDCQFEKTRDFPSLNGFNEIELPSMSLLIFS